jgi:hypothetical protein
MLLQIARAENPWLEARHLRQMNAERQRRYRKKSSVESDLSDEQRELIAWARTARLRDVRDVLQVIHRRKIWTVSRPDNPSAIALPLR